MLFIVRQFVETETMGTNLCLRLINNYLEPAPAGIHVV
jgi:hypothetical protein